jgi:hypothetical protein
MPLVNFNGLRRCRRTPENAAMSNEEPTEKQSVSHAKVDDVNGTDVDIRQSSVGSVTAERATLTQSSVKQLETKSAQLEQASAFRVNAEHVVINQAAATFVTANDIRLVKSNALVVRGATNTVEGDLKAVFFNGDATGNVHMIFNRDSALRFGAGFGAALVGLSVIVRKLFR